jgi:hypothetical protein
MYFFGLVGAVLLMYVLQSAALSDIQAAALFFGGIFVNIAGWLHGKQMANEAHENNKL